MISVFFVHGVICHGIIRAVTPFLAQPTRRKARLPDTMKILAKNLSLRGGGRFGLRQIGGLGMKRRMAKQMDYKTIHEVFSRFRESEAEPKGELNHVNAYTLVVAVALSAQATDAGVNKATEALFYRRKAVN